MRYLKIILLGGMLVFLCACGKQEKTGEAVSENLDTVLSEGKNGDISVSGQEEGISGSGHKNDTSVSEPDWENSNSGEKGSSKNAEKEESVRMVKVNDKLYVDTGEISSVTGRCGVMDFTFDSSVEKGEPAQNDQTNFGIGYEGQVGTRENRLEICINGEWHVFAYHENDFEGVSMKVTEIDDHSLKLEVKNETDLDVQYGDDYLLEMLDKGRGIWVQVPYLNSDIAFHDIAYSVGKDKVSVWEVDWTNMYGTLAAGEYRIVKEVHDFRGTGDYTVYTLTVPFAIP